MVLNDYVDFDNKKLVKFDIIEEAAFDELNDKVIKAKKNKKID